MNTTPLNSFKDWFVKNWPTLLVLVCSVAMFAWMLVEQVKAKSEADSLRDLVQAQQERHLQEMAEMNQSFETQRAAQAVVDQQFAQQISELNQRYEEALEQITITRRTRQRRLEETPTELPSAFESVFGIPPAQPRRQ